MGANLKILTLHDALRQGYHLKVTCLNPECGRSGIYSIRAILDWFRPGRGRSKNASLDVAGLYFVCHPDAGGCGHKGAQLDLVAPHRAPDLEPLIPSAYELKERARRLRG